MEGLEERQQDVQWVQFGGFIGISVAPSVV